MFKRSAGWNTQKTRSVSWTKHVAKRGGNPCLSDLCSPDRTNRMQRLVGLLVRFCHTGRRPESLAEVVAEDLSDGFRKKAIKEAQQVYLRSVKKHAMVCE